MCSCGTKVRVDDHQHDMCHVRDRDGEPCRNPPELTHPIALCRRHIMRLARTEAFTTESITEQHYQDWKSRLNGEVEESDRRRTMRQRRQAHEEQLRQEALAAQSVVYYITRGDLIKIGTTTNMAERMASLLPDAILATEPGGTRLEKQRHRQFKHLRAELGREYFTKHPDLLLHIELVLLEHGPPTITGYPSYDDWHLGERMLVSVPVAARLAGVPARTVYLWVREERLTVVGGRRKTKVNALEVQELAGLRRDGRLPRLDRAG